MNVLIRLDRLLFLQQISLCKGFSTNKRREYTHTRPPLHFILFKLFVCIFAVEFGIYIYTSTIAISSIPFAFLFELCHFGCSVVFYLDFTFDFIFIFIFVMCVIACERSPQNRRVFYGIDESTILFMT